MCARLRHVVCVKSSSPMQIALPYSFQQCNCELNHTALISVSNPLDRGHRCEIDCLVTLSKCRTFVTSIVVLCQSLTLFLPSRELARLPFPSSSLCAGDDVLAQGHQQRVDHQEGGRGAKAGRQGRIRAPWRPRQVCVCPLIPPCRLSFLLPRMLPRLFACCFPL